MVSFRIVRVVKLSRTSAVFLMGECQRMLGVRGLLSGIHGFLVGSLVFDVDSCPDIGMRSVITVR